MSAVAYIRRIRSARYTEQAAQEALTFDYHDRIHNCGPWDEDDTYLRLNGKVAAASAQLLNVILRRTSESDRVRKDNIPALVGWILRHCTATERGAMLADRWSRLNGGVEADVEEEFAVSGYPYYDRAGAPISYERCKQLMENDGYRRVELTELDRSVVATSWMGSNWRPGGGDPPLIFETLVYGGPLDLLGDRYATEGEAIAGHSQWVTKVRDAINREDSDDANRPPLVLSRAMWRELQEMHSPTTVRDGSLLVTGPCAVCKEPGEGNWCATYQWLIRVVTVQAETKQEEVTS